MRCVLSDTYCSGALAFPLPHAAFEWTTAMTANRCFRAIPSFERANSVTMWVLFFASRGITPSSDRTDA